MAGVAIVTGDGSLSHVRKDLVAHFRLWALPFYIHTSNLFIRINCTAVSIPYSIHKPFLQEARQISFALN